MHISFPNSNKHTAIEKIDEAVWSPSLEDLVDDVVTNDELLGDGVDGVDDAGDVAEEGEQQADPELMPASELEEDAEGREDDGDEDVDAVRRSRHLSSIKN